MITFLTTIFAWALKNQVVSGALAFLGSKIYFLVEDYIKKKYFPKPQEIVETKCGHNTIKKKIPSKRNVDLGYFLFFSIVILLGVYIIITYQQFPYLSKMQIVEELEKIKLFTILLVIFFAVKLLSFTTTLEEVFKGLPLIKNFFKK